jgi:hypothetical protein
MSDLINATVDRLVQRGFDPVHAPFAHKVAVMLVTAQGLIDNGGFEYLFGNRFRQEPRMEDFIAVYEAVGAPKSAQAFREALASWKSGKASYAAFDAVLWSSSESNYEKLEAYIASHEQEYV